MKSRLIKLVIVTLATMSLTACITKTYRESNKNVASTQRQINNKRYLASLTSPVVLIKPGYYVNTKPMSLAQLPAWLRQPVSLEAKNTPYQLYWHLAWCIARASG